MGSIAAAFAAVAAALAPPGVASADGATRFVTLPAGRDTVVSAVAPHTGLVVRSRVLPGPFAVPVVALDGTLGGLSFDGRTLVLAERGRGATGRFAVLDTRRLTHRKLELRGAFAFDALSPDGRVLYLIEHVSADDPRLYRVRAYDLVRGRLLDGAVADKRTGQTAMEGLAVSRATSRDGRWAYTLYAGGAHPFVHALDTRSAQAVCIDVHGVATRDLWAARLVVARDRLVLRARGQTLAVLQAP